MLSLSIINSSKDNRSGKVRKARYITIVVPRLNLKLIARRSATTVALYIECILAL